MSKDLLIELKKECIELMIAGSDLGIGSSKLQKILPKFEKLGQKIKPFKMVEDRINTLLNSKKDESEDNLISLLSLANAILLTQAESHIDGKLEILQGNSSEMNTNISNHLIAPVVTALTTKGGGRYNVIVNGFEEGVFSDFRLIPLLIRGLDDKYGDIGEFIYEKLSKSNNLELLPLLKESFNRKGKRADAFKVNLIAKILGEDARDFCIDLLEDSSKEVKLEAVNLLGDFDGTEALLLEQGKSKVKDVRKAAYFGLVKIKSQEGRKELEKAIKKTDYDIALEAMRFCDGGNYSDVLLPGLKDAYEKLIKKQDEKYVGKIIDILKIIKNHKSEEVFQFLIQCLEEDEMDKWKRVYGDYAIPIAEIPLVQCIAEYENIPNKVRDLIESRKDRNNKGIFDLAFKISHKSRADEEIYELYSSYFIEERIIEYMLSKAIDLLSGYLGYEPEIDHIDREDSYKWRSKYEIEGILQPSHKEFDKRWIEILKKYEVYYMLSYTLDKEDTSTVKFMIKNMKKYAKLNKENKGYYIAEKNNVIEILTGLIKIEYEEAYEVLLEQIKYTTGYKSTFDQILFLIPYLPSRYIEEIEKYVIELREMDTSVDDIHIERRIKYIEEVLGTLGK